MKQQVNLRSIIRFEIIGMAVILVLFTMFDFIHSVGKIYRFRQQARKATSAARSKSFHTTDYKKKALKDNQQSLTKGLQTVQEEIKSVKEKISPEKNLPLIALQIEDWAGNLNVELISIKPVDPQIKGKYELQPVEVKFKSSYESLAMFVKQIEDSPSITAVYDVIINKDPLIYPKLDINLICLIIFAHEEESDQLMTE